jgi:hypothetical protein
MNPNLADSDKGMAAPIDIIKVNSRVNGCKETAVKPAPPLADQFRNLIWHVGDPIGRLYISTNTFRDQFPAEDLILCEIYVGGEYTPTIVLLLAKEILVERPRIARLFVLDRDIAIGHGGK